MRKCVIYRSVGGGEGLALTLVEDRLMFVEFQKIQFVQSWPHGQGIWGVEGGVRLQVINFDKLFLFFSAFAPSSWQYHFYSCLYSAFAPCSSSTQRAWWWLGRSAFASLSRSPSSHPSMPVAQNSLSPEHSNIARLETCPPVWVPGKQRDWSAPLAKVQSPFLKFLLNSSPHPR